MQPGPPGIAETGDGEDKAQNRHAIGKDPEGAFESLEMFKQAGQSHPEQEIAAEDAGAEEPTEDQCITPPLAAAQTQATDQEDDHGEGTGVDAVDETAGQH